jgi:ABC-type lipoprotein release transport system permease subunit
MAAASTAGRLETLKVIALIAFRNLFASRLKTVIVGGIILFGAFLVVLGTSLLDSINDAMSRSIIGSVAGHVQVYSAKSKDELTVIGGMDLEGPNLTPFDEFGAVRQVLEKIPNVARVVPMGINGAIVTSGNTIDVALADLRAEVRKLAGGDKTPATRAAYEARRDHVRRMVSVLETDLENVAKLQDEKVLAPEDVKAVKDAAAPAFWQRFDQIPLDGLELLENRIAPLATDADLVFLRYVGTDPTAFGQGFDRMRVVEGTSIPRGQRGFMFAKFTYEEQLKLKTARRLDQIKEGIEVRRVRIADDAELKRLVKENATQVREIELQLDGPKAERFRSKLQAELGARDTDVGKLLAAFFQTTDETFARRYAFFYEQLAPDLQLYRVRIGDTLTIKAFTRSGYVQSVNLKVYGIFTFQGLEKSRQAGELNLMDLVSFRDLYGYLTDEKRAEIAALRGAMATKEVSRENAEAELFGTRDDAPKVPAAATPAEASPEAQKGRAISAEATPGLGLAALESLKGTGGRLAREDLASRVYESKQLESGIVLNAAVILKDPREIPATIAAINAAGAAAGLPLKAVSWQEASGMLGQFVTLARVVLFTAVLIIFVVALVIINNALVMATLERVAEIGTLRAVGAQRRFVLGMLVIEAVAIGTLFGALGAGIGAGVVALIGKIGIPAGNDVAQFFFSGPRLHPVLGTSSLGVALAIVLVVSAVSSLYPAFLAMRVSPRQAMQGEG